METGTGMGTMRRDDFSVSSNGACFSTRKVSGFSEFDQTSCFTAQVVAHREA